MREEERELGEEVEEERELVEVGEEGRELVEVGEEGRERHGEDGGACEEDNRAEELLQRRLGDFLGLC